MPDRKAQSKPHKKSEKADKVLEPTKSLPTMEQHNVVLPADYSLFAEDILPDLFS